MNKVFANRFKELISKLKQAGIPLRYKDDLYMEEDILLDSLLVAMQSIEYWGLDYPGQSYSALIYRAKNEKIFVEDKSDALTKKFRIHFQNLGNKEFSIEIIKTFNNRRKFKKLIKAFKKLQDYYLELEEGKRRNKIANALSRNNN